MTVAAETTRVQFADSGGGGAYGFTITDESELIAVKTGTDDADTTLTYAATGPGETEYTLSGVGTAGGGNITFGTALGSQEYVTVYRDTPLTSTTDLESGGAWSAEVIEAALDKIQRQIQEIHEILGRATTTSITADDAA